MSWGKGLDRNSLAAKGEFAPTNTISGRVDSLCPPSDDIKQRCGVQRLSTRATINSYGL